MSSSSCSAFSLTIWVIRSLYRAAHELLGLGASLESYNNRLQFEYRMGFAGQYLSWWPSESVRVFRRMLGTSMERCRCRIPRAWHHSWWGMMEPWSIETPERTKHYVINLINQEAVVLLRNPPFLAKKLCGFIRLFYNSSVLGTLNLALYMGLIGHEEELRNGPINQHLPCRWPPKIHSLSPFVAGEPHNSSTSLSLHIEPHESCGIPFRLWFVGSTSFLWQVPHWKSNGMLERGSEKHSEH